jgi:hypothetical protein
MKEATTMQQLLDVFPSPEYAAATDIQHFYTFYGID